MNQNYILYVDHILISHIVFYPYYLIIFVLHLCGRWVEASWFREPPTPANPTENNVAQLGGEGRFLTVVKNPMWWREWNMDMVDGESWLMASNVDIYIYNLYNDI